MEIEVKRHEKKKGLSSVHNLTKLFLVLTSVLSTLEVCNSALTRRKEVKQD